MNTRLFLFMQLGTILDGALELNLILWKQLDVVDDDVKCNIQSVGHRGIGCLPVAELFGIGM